MAKLFFKLVFIKMLGWKIVGRFPYEEKKLIILVAPHTSFWDVAVGVSVRAILQFKSHYLVKAELFKNPLLAKFLTWTGGVPVDRGNRKADVVGEVVRIYDTRERFVLALAPEGTRSKVKQLKTGFYRIAKQAQVPILAAGFDFQKKEVVFMEPFLPGDDMDKDMAMVMNFYKNFTGKNPALDLR